MVPSSWLSLEAFAYGIMANKPKWVQHFLVPPDGGFGLADRAPGWWSNGKTNLTVCVTRAISLFWVPGDWDVEMSGPVDWSAAVPRWTKSAPSCHLWKLESTQSIFKYGTVTGISTQGTMSKNRPANYSGHCTVGGSANFCECYGLTLKIWAD